MRELFLKIYLFPCQSYLEILKNLNFSSCEPAAGND